MLLFLCLWNKRRRGSDALNWEKIIWDCSLHEKICLEDYLGNLHLDLRRKRCTASLPGFGQNSSLPKDWFSHPHLPRRSGPISHCSLPRTSGQAPINPCVSACSWHHCLELLESAHAQTCQGQCCPMSRVGVNLPTLSFFSRGDIAFHHRALE